MRVLALDSATDACSAAILRNDAVLARRFETMRRGHSEVLMPLVRDVMQSAGFGFDEIDLIATTIGPGGFTGLRIGLSSARALALASGIPLIGVTTLEAVARAQSAGRTPLLVALDTKRADIYLQLFDQDLTPLGAPTASLPAEIEERLPPGPIAVAGNAADAVLNALSGRSPPLESSDGPALPDAAVVAAIGAARYAANPSPELPRPLYLRPPDARLPDGTLA